MIQPGDMTFVLRAAVLTALAIPGLAQAQPGLPEDLTLDPGELGALTPQDAAARVLEVMMARDRARKAGVSQLGKRSHTSITQMQAGFGMSDPASMLLQEKVYCTDPETGALTFVWRDVSQAELSSRLDQADPNGLNASGSELRAAAVGLGAQSLTINEQLSEGGVPVDLLAELGAPTTEQTGMNVLDPADYFSMYSMFFSIAADARDLANSPDRGAAACAAGGAGASLNENASYAGTEEIDGRTAVIVEIGDLGMSQAVEGGNEVTIDKASLAVDLEQAVPLRTRFEGTVSERRDSRPLTIERRELDYRAVPGSDLYESYRQVLSIGGWTELGPEAAEAQAQMAQLEEQLASVPASQRAMMERMLGPQLEMIRNMASGGGIEIEVIVDEIIVDPGIPGGPAESALVLASTCAPDQTVEECLEELAGD